MDFDMMSAQLLLKRLRGLRQKMKRKDSNLKKYKKDISRLNRSFHSMKA